MIRIISVINDQEKFPGSNSLMLALKFVYVTNAGIERFKCYAKAKLEFKSNVDFHPLRNYKIVFVLIK